MYVCMCMFSITPSIEKSYVGRLKDALLGKRFACLLASCGRACGQEAIGRSKSRKMLCSTVFAIVMNMK